MTMRFRSFATALAVAIVAGAANIGSAQEAPLWLDTEAPAGWNVAGAEVPAAPKSAGIDPQCAAQARPAELDEDQIAAGRGWLLDGGYQGGWGVVIVNATSGYDGMCRPVRYQSFVFVDGAFAGTLSPLPMDSRSDGALVQVFLRHTVDGVEITAEYVRYTDADPLCCASRTTNVTFAVDTGAAVVRPISAFTYAN